MNFVKNLKLKLSLIPLAFLLVFGVNAQTDQMSASTEDGIDNYRPAPPVMKAYPSFNQYDLIIEKDMWYDPFVPSYLLIKEVALIDDTSKKAGQLEIPTDVDRGPIYGRECLTAEDPAKCSNEKINAAIKENIEFPDRAERRNHDGKEVVMFDINRWGERVGNYKVLSKDKPCAGCAKAAVDAVAELEGEWFPAVKNGKISSAKVSIPIIFDVVSK